MPHPPGSRRRLPGGRAVSATRQGLQVLPPPALVARLPRGERLLRPPRPLSCPGASDIPTGTRGAPLARITSPYPRVGSPLSGLGLSLWIPPRMSTSRNLLPFPRGARPLPRPSPCRTSKCVIRAMTPGLRLPVARSPLVPRERRLPLRPLRSPGLCKVAATRQGLQLPSPLGGRWAERCTCRPLLFRSRCRRWRKCCRPLLP